MNDDDDATLWARAGQGDGEAFGVVFDRHRDRVLGHALRLTRHRHDAEDVAALVFLEAWRRRAAVRVVDGSVLPWLLVTTGHVAQNAARARRRHGLALAKLQEHGRRFPRGALREERRALTVVAFAQGGDGERARSAARAFEREHPASLFLEMVRAAVPSSADAAKGADEP